MESPQYSSRRTWGRIIWEVFLFGAVLKTDSRRKKYIFCFVRRRGISTGTVFYQIKWKIIVAITFFEREEKNSPKKKSDVFLLLFILLLRIIFWPNHLVAPILSWDTYVTATWKSTVPWEGEKLMIRPPKF